ncbi:MAG: adenylosuccinate synthase [bacterium]
MKILRKNNKQVKLITGLQWGDEGKGKVVDLFSEKIDIVARFQGGANAGHTVKIDDEVYILHLLPSGILHENVTCVIGNGVVIHPDTLLSEINDLEKKGLSIYDRLLISYGAHLILPYHKEIEAIQEENSEYSIGTTRRGIGPAYADKAYRTGIRMGDLFYEKKYKEIVTKNIDHYNKIIQNVYGRSGVDKNSVVERLERFAHKIKGNIADTSYFMNTKIKEGKKVLLEGAQGMLLDIDLGTYPFVTSSNTTIGGVFSGLGISPKKVDYNIGILKAYTTRVGRGPFPTELTREIGEELRERGGEYGATTGRPRRCGWLDCVLAKFSTEINGIDSLALTKIDVLDFLEEIKICTGYKVNGELQKDYLTDLTVLDKVEPVYEVVPGWQQSTSTIKKYKDLPKELLNYIHCIEESVKAPVGLVSVGPERNETILR